MTVAFSQNALLACRPGIYRLTVEQYQRMIELGILPEDSTGELLRGVPVRKIRCLMGEERTSHSPLHAFVLKMLAKLAEKLERDRWHMQVQTPVRCPPDGLPEPDASIVRGTLDDYREQLCGPGDVSCAIEVAHASLQLDRHEKLAIYAGAGIPQYIIINLRNRTFEVYEDPDPAGEQYRTRKTFDQHKRVALRLPDRSVFEIGAADLLPPLDENVTPSPPPLSAPK